MEAITEFFFGKTKLPSYTVCDSIYLKDLDAVKAILAKDISLINKRIPETDITAQPPIICALQCRVEALTIKKDEEGAKKYKEIIRYLLDHEALDLSCINVLMNHTVAMEVIVEEPADPEVIWWILSVGKSKGLDFYKKMDNLDMFDLYKIRSTPLDPNNPFTIYVTKKLAELESMRDLPQLKQTMHNAIKAMREQKAELSSKEYIARLDELKVKFEEFEKEEPKNIPSEEKASSFIMFEKEVMQIINELREKRTDATIYDAFISHKQTTGNILANLVASKLEQRGFKVFLDVHELDNTHKLEQYVKNTTNFILLITEDLTKSEWCRREAEWALKYKCNIVTIIDDKMKTFPDLATAPEPFPQLLKINAIRFINSMDDECVDRITKRLWVRKVEV